MTNRARAYESRGHDVGRMKAPLRCQDDSSGGLPDRQNDIWLVGAWGAPEDFWRRSGRSSSSRSIRHGCIRDDDRCMRITFRPNLFGRSFGRKIGDLYDDYVKEVFVSACAINKKEVDIVLDTQEVRDSSSLRPTNHPFDFKRVVRVVSHRFRLSFASTVPKLCQNPISLSWLCQKPGPPSLAFPV